MSAYTLPQPRHKQHVARRSGSRLRSVFTHSDEWTTAEAWRNLLGAGVIFYLFCGGLLFAFCRDGASPGWAEKLFHPVHLVIRWAIESLVQ